MDEQKQGDQTQAPTDPTPPAADDAQETAPEADLTVDGHAAGEEWEEDGERYVNDGGRKRRIIPQ